MNDLTDTEKQMILEAVKAKAKQTIDTEEFDDWFHLYVKLERLFDE